MAALTTKVTFSDYAMNAQTQISGIITERTKNEKLCVFQLSSSTSWLAEAKRGCIRQLVT